MISCRINIYIYILLTDISVNMPNAWTLFTKRKPNFHQLTNLGNVYKKNLQLNSYCSKANKQI